MEKPIGFERRRLAAENTPRRKNTATRRTYFNITTYFNFYFNAKDLMDDIELGSHLSKAQKFFTDSIEIEDEDNKYLAAHTLQLDTIIAKCNAGVLLHDLNNHWVDDLLFLMGKAYYYKGSYDTAYIIFQYINRTFGENQSGYVYIGEKDSEGNMKFDKIGIALPEPKTNFIKKIFINPHYAKNDAMVWLVKTMVKQNKLNAALSLTNLLAKDEGFPDRLKGDLYNLNGMLNYAKGNYFAAANILEKAIDYYPKEKKNRLAIKATTVAKIYEKARFSQYAYQMYIKAAKLTTEPFLKMQAKIYALGLDYIQYLHRDINNILTNRKYKLYKSVALFSISKKLYTLDSFHLAKYYANMAIKSKNLDSINKQELLVLLSKLALQDKQYLQAGLYLDSAHLKNNSLPQKYKIYNYLNIIDLAQRYTEIKHYDSLLAIVALPRKQLEQRIRELATKVEITASEDKYAAQKTIPPPKTTTMNDWYFGNTERIKQGEEVFFKKYGQRPNIDNWQRKTGIFASNTNVAENLKAEDISNTISPYKEGTIRERIWNSLPITSEKRALVIDSLRKSLYFYAVNIYAIANDIPEATKSMQRLTTLSQEYTINEIGLMRLLGMPIDEHVVVKVKNKEAYQEKKYMNILNTFLSNHPLQCLELIAANKDFFKDKEKEQVEFIKACSLYQIGDKERAMNMLNTLLKKTTNPNLQEKINLLLAYYHEVVKKIY
ncbi:MAG: hypothetical protein ACRC0A_03720 [Chitinophagaceae bacterium]